MTRLLAVLCTLGVGGLVALQPPANALLGRTVGDLGAALLSLALSLALIAILLLATGNAGRLGGIVHYKPEYALGGLAGAAIVFVSLVTVRSLGAGGVVALLVCAQLIVSVLADRFAWLGLARVPLTPARLGGLALMAAGTLLVTRS